MAQFKNAYFASYLKVVCKLYHTSHFKIGKSLDSTINTIEF